METDREPIPRYSSVYTSLFDDKQFIIIEVHVIRVVYRSYICSTIFHSNNRSSRSYNKRSCSHKWIETARVVRFIEYELNPRLNKRSLQLFVLQTDVHSLKRGSIRYSSFVSFNIASYQRVDRNGYRSHHYLRSNVHARSSRSTVNQLFGERHLAPFVCQPAIDVTRFSGNVSRFLSRRTTSRG